MVVSVYIETKIKLFFFSWGRELYHSGGDDILSTAVLFRRNGLVTVEK